MIALSPPIDELAKLIEACCLGELTPEQELRLRELVCSDRECRIHYVLFMNMHAMVERREGHAGKDVAGILETRCDSPIEAVSSPTVSLPFLSTALHSPVGFFSSGWPVAYLVATVIFGIAALIGSVVYVSHPVQVAKQSVSLPSPISSLSTTVGRITDMVDCKWNGGSRVCLGQKLDLVSGLMEITYDTGAKVILQGPVTYSVETNGGYLAVGKLTGKLEKKSSNPLSLTPNPFVIHTPTATVTDLGTEFGVEVSESGVTETNVFVGAVQVARIGGKDVADRGITVIRAGQFARVAANEESPVSVGQRQPDVMATRFARAIPKKVSAADDYATLVLSMQPFAYYRMERPAAGQDPNTILDSAPSGHHGTLHFAEGYNSEPWRPGRFGDSFAPRGEFAGDYVDFQDFPSTDTNQLSVSTWVYYGPRSADAVIASGMMPVPVLSTHCDGWQFYCEVAGDDLLAAVNDRNVNHVYVRASTPLPKVQWQHVAMVADGSVLHLYCNGVEVGQVPCDGVAHTPPLKHFTIGSVWNWPAAASVAEAKPCSFWSGRIDEFAIFDRALSARQVQQLFEGGPHKPTPDAP
jgi:hypothetical protein